MSIVRSPETESLVCRLGQAIATYIGFGRDPEPIVANAKPIQRTRVTQRPQFQVVKPEVQPDRRRKRRLTPHPQLRQPKQDTLPNSIRTARHDCMRGIAAAKSGALDIALRHWRRAVAAADIDLSAIPEFWDLTRGQMMVAIDAYEQVGKYQEAALLDEQLSSFYRPTLVGTSISPARTRTGSRRAVN